jgi:hypothetical protein
MLGSFLITHTMIKEKPEEKTEIPSDIAIKYDQEKKKFESYNLDHPEKFFNACKDKFRSKESAEPTETDIFKYLIYLNYLANILLSQHLLVQAAYNYNYMAKYLNELHKKRLEALKITVGPDATDDKTVRLRPDNDESFNETISHIGIIKHPVDKEYDIAELKILFGWIIDPNKGKWMQALGTLLKTNYEIGINDSFLYDKIQPLYNLLSDHSVALLNVIGKIKQRDYCHLIDNNSIYIQQLANNEKDYLQKKEKYLNIKKQQEKRKKDLGKDYFPENLYEDWLNKIKQIINTYSYSHTEYEKLYAIIRQEINKKIKELLMQKPGDIEHTKKVTQLAATFQTEEGKNIIPPILPLQLPTFDDPAKVVSIFSFDGPLEVFRNHWIENQKAKKLAPQKIKKVRKKKITPEKGDSEPVEEKTPESESSSEEEIIETKVEPKKVKEASDGSYIFEGDETNERITIHNPKNKTTEVIFKTDKTFVGKEKLPKIIYTTWVKMWFEDPAQALVKQGYITPGTKKFTAEHLRWKPIVLHAFSPLVDEYVEKWGTITKIPSRRASGKQDILVTLPGMIIYPEGSKDKSETGVFAYLIDSDNGQWYHRMFEPQTGQKLIQSLFDKGYFSAEMTGYYDVFFPALGKKK